MTPPPDGTLLAQHDALLIDLDGVVYVGHHAVPQAVQALRAARDSGVHTAYVTNNASRPPSTVAEHLRSFGLDVDDADVVTSAQAGARLIADRLPAGSAVLVVGGPGVPECVAACGLVPVTSAEPTPAAVLMGYGANVCWSDLAEASYAVQAGALFVATNGDLSFPTPRGLAPGNGTLAGAVAAATGVQPIFAGKPFAPLIEESIRRVNAVAPLMVGDRLDTDIEAADISGIPSLLVFTGVTDVRTLLLAPSYRRPTYVSADLRGLALLPSDLVVTSVSSGPDGLGPLRAATQQAWPRVDQGDPDPLRDIDVDALQSLVEQALER